MWIPDTLHAFQKVVYVEAPASPQPTKLGAGLFSEDRMFRWKLKAGSSRHGCVNNLSSRSRLLCLGCPYCRHVPTNYTSIDTRGRVFIIPVTDNQSRSSSHVTQKD